MSQSTQGKSTMNQYNWYKGNRNGLFLRIILKKGPW